MNTTTQVKERPILFMGEMVRAIFADTTGGEMTDMEITGMRVSVGGPTYTIQVEGKYHYFELPAFCALFVCNKDGDPRKEPGPRHAFWKAVSLWQKQGKRVDSNMICIWETDVSAHERVVPIVGNIIIGKFPR